MQKNRVREEARDGFMPDSGYSDPEGRVEKCYVKN